MSWRNLLASIYWRFLRGLELVSCSTNNLAFVRQLRDRRPILIATKARLFMGQGTSPGVTPTIRCQESGGARVSGLLLRGKRSLLGPKFSDDRPDLTDDTE